MTGTTAAIGDTPAGPKSAGATASPPEHRWRTLALVVLTNMNVAAIPVMALSVLFKEISDDLGLTVVQVGIVYGVTSLPFVIFSLFGGALADRLGPRRIIIVGTIIIGLFGIARGFAFDFVSLVGTVFLMSAVVPLVVMSGSKTIGESFPSHQLGLAMGLNAMGMAFGFFFGSILSAAVLSPLLGGWRWVFVFYGAATLLISVPWILLPKPVHRARGVIGSSGAVSLKDNALHVIRLKDVWLLGFALFGFNGAMQGVLGYLPLYLRNTGWIPNVADTSVAAFHLISMAFVLPIALWSDRLRSRKPLIMSAAALSLAGVLLMSRVHGGGVWAAVLMTGFVRDGFMAIILTMVIETRGVGPAYAGTATGLMMTISNIAKVAAPPIGNSLENFSTGGPFVFWAALVAFGIVCLFLYGRTSSPTPPLPVGND